MIGARVSHYIILERIGAGGMGIVYKAEDTRLSRQVALKFLPQAFTRDPQALERFRREARTASGLNHPHICTVYEMDAHAGQPFIAMEYLQGQTLKQRIAQKPLRNSDILQFAVQIADALEIAHLQGVVHRDIKSTNIFVTERDRVKILDFGLAKLTINPYVADYDNPSIDSTIAGDPLTSTGITMGTVGYMSPEQAQGEELDSRTDIFSLGVVLYEMATGTMPFAGRTGAAILSSMLTKDPDHPSQKNPILPPGLEVIIERALEKDRRYRYQTVKQILEDLTALTENLSPKVRSSAFGRPAGERSIAVMPFSNTTPDKDFEYFTDGLADDLINALTKIDGLRVVSRTSAFRLRQKMDDIREIGRQLNVRVILEGSVRRSGDKLRISAQLVNVADGYELWSERYDVEFKDVFSVQDEISRSIAESLKVKLALRHDKRLIEAHTNDMEAYNLYLKGRFYWNKRTPAGLQKAMEHFQQAITRDPNYAQAYSGLADCYLSLPFHSPVSPKRIWPLAKSAAARAVELDDTLAAAHASLAHACSNEWNWNEAEREFRRAFELNPGYAVAHQWFATNYLSPMGRLDEAVAELRRAAELDPLSLIINTSIGGTLHFQRKYDEAIEQFHKTLDMQPDFPFAHWNLGRSLVQCRRFDEAEDAFQKALRLSGGLPLFIGSLAHLFIRTGRSDEADSLIEAYNAPGGKGPLPTMVMAALEVARNNHDAAFEWMDKAYEERSGWLAFINCEPSLEPLRQDPRFAALVQKLGLE